MTTKPNALFLRRIALLVLGMLAGSIIVLATQFTLAQQPTLDGFFIREIRFDESTGDKRPTPRIPSTWRFVGVSNGEKINSNNLWFQDKDGTIYLVQGFTSYGKFIVQGSIQKLDSGE